MEDIMRKVGIYGIFNTINNKVLIGSSGNIESRWKRHISDANRKAHCNPHFQSAWVKYGRDAFQFKIIEECTKDVNILISKEDYWMSYYNSLNKKHGYNMQDAQITFKSKETCKKISESLKGRKFSKETRAKMSKSAKTKIFTKEHRRNIGEKSKGNKNNVGRKASKETKRKLSLSRTGEKNHNYGQHLSTETKRKLSEANKGHEVSEETRRKLSKAAKGRKHSEETKIKMIEIAKKRWETRDRTVSERTRKKLSKAAKGRKFSEEHKKRLSEAHKKYHEQKQKSEV